MFVIARLCVKCLCIATSIIFTFIHPSIHPFNQAFIHSFIHSFTLYPTHYPLTILSHTLYTTLTGVSLLRVLDQLRELERLHGGGGRAQDR
jgi:hypothetical protein